MDTNKFGAYTAHTMARLFGTNGIRGVFGEDMSLQFAHDITLSLAAHFGKGPVLVGYDGRHSGAKELYYEIKAKVPIGQLLLHVVCLGCRSAGRFQTCFIHGRISD